MVGMIRQCAATALSISAVLACAAAVQEKGTQKIFAQKLVDEALAKHREVIVLAMHVTPPGKTSNVIIASNIGRMGKRADEDDLRVIETGKPNLEVNKTGDRFEVELVIQDRAGKTIGAMGVVFMYKNGDDKAAFQKKAEEVRDEMRAQIASLDELFEPGKS
jgi:iron complex outermembrane receptor protein